MFIYVLYKFSSPVIYLVSSSFRFCTKHLWDLLQLFSLSLVCHILDLILGWIQDLTKGGSDKCPPKAVAPSGVRKFFNFRASEMQFPAFSGAI